MKAIAVVMLVVLATGLSVGCSVAQGPGPVEPFVARYFEAIKSRDVDKAMTFYAEGFFNTSPTGVTEDQWRALLPKLQDKLGDLQSYRLVQWKIDTWVGTGKPSGTYYSLRYEVTYSRFSATEDIVVFRPANGTDKDLKVLGHHINSPGLLN